MNVVVEQTYEAVVDGERLVALPDAVTDSCAGRSVHSAGWGTYTKHQVSSC